MFRAELLTALRSHRRRTYFRGRNDRFVGWRDWVSANSPSTFERYAVDGDGDGTSTSGLLFPMFAPRGNYLVKNLTGKQMRDGATKWCCRLILILQCPATASVKP